MAVFKYVPAGDILVEDGEVVIYEDLLFIRQTIACRLRFGKGEWFIDEAEGVPYYQVVLRKNPDLSVIRALFKRVILSVPGVTSVPTITLALDATRTLSVAFEAVCRDGTIVVAPGDPSFTLPAAA